MDIEITIDILNLLNKQTLDRVVLPSGDSDFTALVKELQKRDVLVTIVSVESLISRDLRNQADEFWDLADLT